MTRIYKGNLLETKEEIRFAAEKPIPSGTRGRVVHKFGDGSCRVDFGTHGTRVLNEDKLSKCRKV